LASAAIAASSVSAGGVRGVAREEDIGATRGRRYLTSLDLWRSKCNTRNLESCAGNNFEACTQCLYAQSLFSSVSITGLKSCATFLCNGCENDVIAFYDCGVAPPPVSTPVRSPVTDVAPPPVSAPIGSPVTDVTDPVGITLPVATVTEIAESTTSTGCPLLQPETGADCTGLIPNPFLYHKCYYGQQICSCRTDSPYYMCNQRQETLTPVVTPVEAPVAIITTPMTTPNVNGVPIPAGVDFSFGSAWCPSNITNCDPCGDLLPEGDIDGSCTARTTFDNENTSYIAEIQCRCFTQENPDPVWECRYFGGTLGTITIPVAPSCTDPEPETPIEEEPVAETPMEPVQETPVEEELVPDDNTPEEEEEEQQQPVQRPVLITEIPLTKVCLSRLPTSGLNGCDLPEGAVCCHNVQIGIATICTCDENRKFQCEAGFASDCPDDQNPNVIPHIPYP
jgi:hypothetical protein